MVTKEHFHSMNALRFFSYFVVFLSHLPYELFGKLTFLHLNGALGVYFFFILSGFLITYILLEQKSINFKKFFVRRILRIWPMYYSILLFAFLSPFIIRFLGLNSSDVGYEPNWFMSCLFLENYKIIHHGGFANVSPLPVLWSVCIEEHFYIIWGLVLVFINKNKLVYAMISIIIMSYISRYFFYKNDLMFKDILTNFDYFMYGAIAAYFMIYKKEKTLSLINKCPSYIKSLVIILTLFYVFLYNYISFDYYVLIQPLVFGCLFTALLLIFLPRNNVFKISSKSIFSKLGVYTYSLYLNHVIIINLLIQVFRKMNIDFKSFYLLFIFLAFFGTVLASKITYNLIEKPFLNLKKNYV